MQVECTRRPALFHGLPEMSSFYVPDTGIVKHLDGLEMIRI